MAFAFILTTQSIGAASHTRVASVRWILRPLYHFGDRAPHGVSLPHPSGRVLWLSAPGGFTVWRYDTVSGMMKVIDLGFSRCGDHTIGDLVPTSETSAWILFGNAGGSNSTCITVIDGERLTDVRLRKDFAPSTGVSIGDRVVLVSSRSTKIEVYDRNTFERESETIEKPGYPEQIRSCDGATAWISTRRALPSQDERLPRLFVRVSASGHLEQYVVGAGSNFVCGDGDSILVDHPTWRRGKMVHDDIQRLAIRDGNLTQTLFYDDAETMSDERGGVFLVRRFEKAYDTDNAGRVVDNTLTAEAYKLVGGPECSGFYGYSRGSLDVLYLSR